MRISSYGGESELESPYLPLIVHGDLHAIRYYAVLVILLNPEEIDDYRKPYEIPKTGRRKQGGTVR
jgi:hypothetical protein